MCSRFSRIYRNSSGDGRAFVTDPPASMALSSLQWLAVGTEIKTEPNCMCICKAAYTSSVQNVMSFGKGKAPVNTSNGCLTTPTATEKLENSAFPDTSFLILRLAL
jgi:hypothetical protein